MSLIQYHIDMTNLEMPERQRIYEEANRAAFMDPYCAPKLEAIEFFMEENQKLSDWVKIPDNCHVTPSGSYSQMK